jgi:hypothetical protein
MTGTNERYERQQLHRRLQRIYRKLFLQHVFADNGNLRQYALLLQPSSSANHSGEILLHHPPSMVAIGEKENKQHSDLQNELQIKVQPQ